MWYEWRPKKCAGEIAVIKPLSGSLDGGKWHNADVAESIRAHQMGHALGQGTARGGILASAAQSASDPSSQFWPCGLRWLDVKKR